MPFETPSKEASVSDGKVLKDYPLEPAAGDADEEAEKTSGARSRADAKDWLKWSRTRDYGFSFEKVPARENWKVASDEKEGSPFLSAENKADKAKIFIVADPKDPDKKYSGDMRDYEGAARKMTERIGAQNSLKRLKIFRVKDPAYSEKKVLKVGFTGRAAGSNISIRGASLFFETHDFFVGIYGMSEENIFERMNRVIDRMFRSLFVVRKVQGGRKREAVARRETGAPPGTEAPSASPARKKQSSKEVRQILYPGRKSTAEADRPSGRRVSSDVDPDDVVLDKPSTTGKVAACKLCGGKGRCLNPECVGGFILCETCRAKDPPKCKKCKGTGLEWRENDYTRQWNWDYCRKCRGTGKEKCEKNCLGGKVKCAICNGTGLCRSCRGKGFFPE